MTKTQYWILVPFVVSAAAGCKTSTAPDHPLGGALAASITPGGGTIARCNTVQLALNVSDASGAAVATDSVRWASSAPTMASVSANGLVHALSDSPGVT